MYGSAILSTQGHSDVCTAWYFPTDEDDSIIPVFDLPPSERANILGCLAEPKSFGPIENLWRLYLFIFLDETGALDILSFWLKYHLRTVY